MKRKIILIAAPILVIAWCVFLFWLTYDEDELLYSTDYSTYRPITEEGATNFETLMDLFDEKKNLPHSYSILIDNKLKKDDPEAYREHLLKNKSRIIKNYEYLSDDFELLRQLSQAGPIQDNSKTFDSPILNFQSMRALFLSLQLQIELSAIDSDTPVESENAIASYKVICEFYQNSRLLVHGMLCIVLLQRLHESLESALPRMTIEQKAQLYECLSKPIDFIQEQNLLLFAEYCQFGHTYDGLLEQAKFYEKPFFLRNATLNYYGSYIAETHEYAREQDWESMRKLSDKTDRILEQRSLKNIGGQILLAMAVPAISRVTEQAYDCQLKREALKEKVEASLNAE